MKLNFTLTLSFILLSIAATAQDLTGIWRGYFSSSSGLYREDTRTEMYKYEIQIDQQSNNAVQGVTYSYKSTVFYGKAALQGIYTTQTKNLILKETSMIDVKIADKSEPCLMTCYLEYTKIGKLEVLQGTFISINARDKSDCGSGKVYLERVTETDFELEEFLVKKPGVKGKLGKKEEIKSGITKSNPTLKTNPTNKPQASAGTKPAGQSSKTTTAPTGKNNTSKTTQKPVQQPGKSTTTTTKPNTPAGKTTTTQKPATQPGKSATTLTQPGTGKTNTTAPPVVEEAVPVTATPNNFLKQRVDTPITRSKEASQPVVTRIPVPKVLTERENNLVKTIYTNEKTIKVEIYDNGTIDNDTISLYHNNKLAISHGMLSYTPLTLKISCEEEKRHELILVAENLGEIPPNTALMVITAGKKRYEIFLTSNEERNAKVVIEYRE